MDYTIFCHFQSQATLQCPEIRFSLGMEKKGMGQGTCKDSKGASGIRGLGSLLDWPTQGRPVWTSLENTGF